MVASRLPVARAGSALACGWIWLGLGFGLILLGCWLDLGWIGVGFQLLLGFQDAQGLLALMARRARIAIIALLGIPWIHGRIPCSEFPC